MLSRDHILFKGSLSSLPLEIRQEYIRLAQARYRDRFNLPPPNTGHYNALLSLPESDSFERLIVIAGSKDSLIGYASSFRNTKYDNTDRAEISIFVREPFQNTGYEFLLLSELLTLLSEKATILTFSTREGSSIEQFVLTLGCVLAFTGRWSVKILDRSELESVKGIAEQRLLQAKSKGFSIIKIENGRFPRNIYDDIISMYETLWRDMPSEDLDEEPEVLTPERFKERYDILLKTQQRAIAFLAIHDATGKPAGITEAYLSSHHPLVAFQDDTGVLKPYRGNRLGLALKTQLLEYLLEKTNATHWITQNAKSNEHMWRINEKLGYQEWVTHKTYQIKRESLLAKLETLKKE